MNHIDNNSQEYEIDLGHLFKYLLKRVWILILTGIIGAAAAFSYATYLIAPKYESSVMLYVNNSSFSIGSSSLSISASEISAAQSLVKTYIVILQNRTTLEKVIENTGVDYTYEQLSKMIEASQVNDTEVFQIKITSLDPNEAATIANGIAAVLPGRVEEIIDGASMKLVDMAVVNPNKVSPSITKYTAMGFALGFLIACGILVIAAMLDDTIHDEDYILQNYDFPILAKIPDFTDDENTKHTYYASGSRK